MDTNVFGSLRGKGVRGVVWCGFRPFLVLHFAVWFNQNHNYTAPYFCGYMCGAVRCIV